jgi:pimeloyl-ACP methyl ester carboxylesterase
MALRLPQPLRRIHRGVAGKLALASTHGVALLPCATPITSVSYTGARPGQRLIVFLPGIGDIAEDFEARGLIDAMTASSVVADAIAVDAHYGYYARRSVIDRLAHDIVLPARRRGYHDIWLVGVSLGGMGALSYAMHHPEHIARLVLLAPYLGEAKVIREFDDARGLAQAPADEGSAAAHTRRLWTWISRYDGETGLFPKLYLGYGKRDRFAKSNAQLARHLPHAHALAIPGGHDWRTWKRLWGAFLARWSEDED